MTPNMLERILAFELLYADTLPPPPPVLSRQQADRLSSEDYMSDLSDSIEPLSDSESD
jgi:hypothetical protein